MCLTGHLHICQQLLDFVDDPHRVYDNNKNNNNKKKKQQQQEEEEEEQEQRS